MWPPGQEHYYTACTAAIPHRLKTLYLHPRTVRSRRIICQFDGYTQVQQLTSTIVSFVYVPTKPRAAVCLVVLSKQVAIELL